ncbi:MAG: hypothetical protein WC975_10800 [Phycisphaerae bacterium]
MTPIPPNILTTLKKNLAVLNKIEPALAKQLADINWPEDLKFIPALDQTPTAFSSQFGRSGWFAFSGAPKVREQVICDQFSPGSSNVILPATGQGGGLRLLLDRFDPARSIFVWEPKVLHLAVLLALYDFSNDLSGQRLIFLTDPDLKKGLLDYLSAHLELALPDKMISWPWISENDMQAISVTVDQAITELTSLVSEKTAILQEQFNQSTATPIAKNIKNVKIFSLTHQNLCHQLANDFYRAAEKLKFKADIFLLDQPAHTSGISILNHLLASPPEAIISIGIEKNRWMVKIPPTIPFITILAPPGIALGEKALENLTPEDNEIFVLGSQSDMDHLKAKIPAKKLFAFELAVNPDAFCPLQKTADVQVLVFADRPDPDPEKIGIRQQSHKHLWHEIEKMIGQNPLAFHADQTGNLIRKASNYTGIQFSDQDLINSFTSLVKNILAPAVVASKMVADLINAGLKIKICGSGWEAISTYAHLARSLPTSPQELNELINSAELVLYIDNQTNCRQIVFNTLCAGQPVAVKTLPDGKMKKYHELTHAVHYLNHAADLAAQLHSILQNRPANQHRSLLARKYLAENHNYAKLLQRIFTR